MAFGVFKYSRLCVNFHAVLDQIFGIFVTFRFRSRATNKNSSKIVLKKVMRQTSSESEENPRNQNMSNLSKHAVLLSSE